MAEWAPLSIAERKPFSRDGGTLWTPDIVCVHTMVGSLFGSWSWAASKGTVWHFGTSGSGQCLQCLPLNRRSGANLYGNHRVIAIENADMGVGFGSWNGQCGSVPPFTAAQKAKLIQLIAWICIAKNIPPVLIPDTRPGRRGIAYHRQGCNPWRCGSCELWSKAYGKCCPDNARIHQLIYEIIPAVANIVRGGGIPVPAPTPIPEVPTLEDDMQYLVKRASGSGAARNAVYVVLPNFKKVHLNSEAAFNEANWLFNQTLIRDAGNTPREWPNHWVDLMEPFRPGVDDIYDPK